MKKVLGTWDDDRVKFLNAQEAEDEIETGVEYVKALADYAKRFERVPIPIAELKVGLKCGGSDGLSGITANPLVGRFSDMLMAFPGFIFTIALVSFIGVGLPNMILAMSLTGWTYYARISRSLVLSVKNNVYIEQARLGGASNWKILLHYIIPNVLPSLLVNIFQDIGGELLTISGLSLLGLGSPPPTPEWGFMLSEGKDYMYSAPWMLLFPGMVILISVVIFNLLGDCIQDLMNPKENVW